MVIEEQPKLIRYFPEGTEFTPEEYAKFSPEEQEFLLLRGFRDLVRESLGYYYGAKMVREEQRNAIVDFPKETLDKAREKLREAIKPYNEKRIPLERAWRFCLNVFFPESLEELGAPVSPHFSLSDWMAEATKP